MSTARVSLAKYFIPGCVGRELDLDLRVRPPPAVASESLEFFKTHVCVAGVSKVGRGQLWKVSTSYCFAGI